MIVTLISNKSINSIILPEKVTGRYWLSDASYAHSETLFNVEGIDDNWVLKSNQYFKLIDHEKNVLKSVILKELNIYVLKNQSGEKLFIYTEPISKDRETYTKYLVRDDIDLKIGRTDDNDITFHNPCVTKNHALLSLHAGKWMIKDCNSSNGTFVNQKRITQTDLRIGDTVYIMGLKIIIGKNFIAFNNPDSQVVLKENVLQKYIRQEVTTKDEDEDSICSKQINYFYRSPRFKRDIKTAKFKIDSPPQSPLAEEMPLILVLGSSLAMGAMSLVTLANAITTGNVMSMTMGGSMLIGTVLLPIISKRYEKAMKNKKEQKRQKKYREYLDVITVKINEECQNQEEILKENYVTIQECEKRICNAERNLWERGYGQNDFLRLRLGYGQGLLDAEFAYSERKFSLDDDNLQEELYTLCERPKTLKQIPITYSAFEHYVSGIIGDRKDTIDFAKGLIFQIASLYSYDEVKLVFLYDDAEASDMDFVKWLPHVWSDDHKFRFIAGTPQEVKEVSAYLEKIIEERSEMNENDLDEVTPYFVIFSMSRDLAIKSDMLKQLYAKKVNIHFSIITLYNELKSLPKECTMVVEIDHEKGRLFNKNDINGTFTDFTADINLTVDALSLSTKLANLQLENFSSGTHLPSMLTFLQMFQVGKVEHLNALTRWKENDPTKSLETVVGVDTLGEPFKLDLHEKFHGPHGLIAGMTGSGKSEFIITFILSLAVNYHPNEVAFILIDYKGGGMAKSFEQLPHTAGIITNLDGPAIKRSLISIESELKRRQAIFAQAGKQIGESNIDIYKYQKLYREGTVSEPLQHLFIISDEFAELKTQQPEFMTQLVSAARIGRSLGVHLILATQKPSGVVDDQIWSNSKFRVCLKVQERADSMDMLKRADAAELTDTGRFYLQVGYNELFELGQSAWSGAPYYPSDKVMEDKDNSVAVIDRNGHIIRQAKLNKERLHLSQAKKQLDVITDYLKTIAVEEHIKIRPLWLEPIPEIILLSQLKEKYHPESKPFELNPVIGEYDDPAHQQQCLMRLPLSEEGNTVIYGVAGSGKTSFLNAMIYSLIHEHTPEEVHLYLLDFASETLRAFAKAPHVGEVILSYESEKVSNLFKMLLNELEKRKKCFADYGGDYRSYLSATGNKYHSIVVVINNFAAFTEIYEEKEEAITFLSREGTKYGLYFVLTSLSTSGVRFRLLQNFKQLIVLQLNDESDYSSVVGKTDGLYPSKYKGRGLLKRDAIYEFQTAMLCNDAVPFSFIQKECLYLQKQWQGETAKKVPILPEQVDIAFLDDYWNENNLNQIPIGVEKHTLQIHYYSFTNQYITMLMSSNLEYQAFFADFVNLLDHKNILNAQVFDIPKTITLTMKNTSIYTNTADCESAIASLFDLVLYRNNTFKDAKDKAEVKQQFEPVFIIINSLSALRSVLSDETEEKLMLLLEKGSTEYHMNILIAEQIKNVSAYAYEKWYKNQVNPSDGIWVGSGICEQYQMKVTKVTDEMHEDITDEFGYVLQQGKAIKLKLLKQREEEVNYG